MTVYYGALLLGVDIGTTRPLVRFSGGGSLAVDAKKIPPPRPQVRFSGGGYIIPLKPGQFLGGGLQMGVFSDGLRGAALSGGGEIVAGPTSKSTWITTRISGGGAISVHAHHPFWRVLPIEGNPYAAGPIITTKRVKEQVEAYLGWELSDSDLQGLALALNRLGDIGCVYEQAEGVVEEADAWYHLPDSLTYLQQVKNGKSDEPYTGYQVIDGMISFDVPGTYRILYRRMPKPPTTVHQRLEVHPAYMQALVWAMAGWAKVRHDDANPDGHRLLQQADQEAVRVFATLRRTNQPRRMRVVR